MGLFLQNAPASSSLSGQKPAPEVRTNGFRVRAIASRALPDESMNPNIGKHTADVGRKYLDQRVSNVGLTARRISGCMLSLMSAETLSHGEKR